MKCKSACNLLFIGEMAIFDVYQIGYFHLNVSVVRTIRRYSLSILPVDPLRRYSPSIRRTPHAARYMQSALVARACAQIAGGCGGVPVSLRLAGHLTSSQRQRRETKNGTKQREHLQPNAIDKRALALVSITARHVGRTDAALTTTSNREHNDEG